MASDHKRTRVFNLFWMCVCFAGAAASAFGVLWHLVTLESTPADCSTRSGEQRAVCLVIEFFLGALPGISRPIVIAIVLAFLAVLLFRSGREYWRYRNPRMVEDR